MVMDIGSLSIRFWGDEKRDMLPLFAALLMVQLFDLVPRLAGHMDAEPLVELDVLLRDDDGEVRVAAAQTAELLLRELGDGDIGLGLGAVYGARHAPHVPVRAEARLHADHPLAAQRPGATSRLEPSFDLDVSLVAI